MLTESIKEYFNYSPYPELSELNREVSADSHQGQGD
uniref:Uncharacterized protein n=1 Tax=Anguilla anguilla TaxID=7936 RepID=A0A0E9TL42_ANGAN